MGCGADQHFLRNAFRVPVAGASEMGGEWWSTDADRGPASLTVFYADQMEDPCGEEPYPRV
jgi:hypothetical protein